MRMTEPAGSTSKLSETTGSVDSDPGASQFDTYSFPTSCPACLEVVVLSCTREQSVHSVLFIKPSICLRCLRQATSLRGKVRCEHEKPKWTKKKGSSGQ